MDYTSASRPTSEPGKLVTVSGAAFGAARNAARVKGWAIWIGLAVVWFATAQRVPWIEPDEGRYAEIPREMAAGGDWITPRLDGLKYLEKPPLQYWATATVYKVFGISEWSARVWSLGLAFLCLPLTFAAVARLYGRRAGLGALAVLATSPLFVIVGHLNLLDAGFSFCLTAAVFAFGLAQAAPSASRQERSWMLAAWLAAGLAVLSKGIVVLVLASLSLLGYSVAQRDWRPWRRLHVATGLPLFLIVTTPWLIAVSLQNPEFPRFFFLHEHFARFLTPAHARTGPWWYFLAIGAIALLPWLVELRAACRSAWRGSHSSRLFEPMRFLLIYAAVVLAFFSLSSSKLPPYILPMLPALAAILGAHVAEQPAMLRRAARFSAAAVAIVAVGLLVYTVRRYETTSPQLLGWAFAGAVVAVLAAVGVKLRGSLERNALLLAAGSLLAWQCLLVAYGAPPSARSARPLVQAVRPYIGEHTALFSVGQYRQTVPPYLRRTLTLVAYRGELDFGLQQEPTRNYVTREEFTRQWRQSPDAVAFFKPKLWQSWAGEGLPGRIIASDYYSIVVSRR